MKKIFLMLGLLGVANGFAQNGATSPAGPDTHGVDMRTQQGEPPAPAGAPGSGKYFPPAPADPKLPTLWLIGDSTVRNGSLGNGTNMGQWGWGAPLTFYFDPKKINVVNFAYGGTSSRSYYEGFWWPRVKSEIKKGDFVILQFGANDNSGASLSGVGNETGPGRNGATIHSFGWYLQQYVREGRDLGATVIIASLTPHKSWSADGHLKRDTTHAAWSEQVAKETGAPFIALNELIARRYDAMGAAKVTPLYVPTPKENLHTGWDGAVVNAECVVAGLKAMKDDPLAGYFSARGNAVAAVDVSQPEAPVKAADGGSTGSAGAAAMTGTDVGAGNATAGK